MHKYVFDRCITFNYLIRTVFNIQNIYNRVYKQHGSNDNIAAQKVHDGIDPSIDRSEGCDILQLPASKPASQYI